jgi:copper chaperone CopZ
MAQKMEQEASLMLQRLNCNGCVKKVTTALQGLPGVVVVSADIASKVVHVRYEPQQSSVEQMKTALAEAHYPVVGEQAAD